MAAENQLAPAAAIIADRWACGDPPGRLATPTHPIAAAVGVLYPGPPPAAPHPQATGAGTNHHRVSTLQGVRCPICRIIRQQQQQPSSSGNSLLADFGTGLITGAVVGIVLIKVAQAGLRCPGTTHWPILTNYTDWTDHADYNHRSSVYAVFYCT